MNPTGKAPDIQSWIGRTETATQTLTPNIVEQFNATFDRTSGTRTGDPAPLLIHLCLTQPAAPMSALGRDGHPELGGFLPPVSLPRRMWAGGAFTFLRPLHVGDTVIRHSVIKAIEHKQGRSGALCFVTVEHRISAEGEPAIVERQDIVYRDTTPANPNTSPPTPAEEGASVRIVHPTPTLLFRYSALTFNGHRIHYDRQFCTETEGYPGLVVHGPLQATLLCQFAADLKAARPTRFQFRSLSPLYDTTTFSVQADATGTRLWTAAPGGPVAMQATVTF